MASELKPNTLVSPYHLATNHSDITVDGLLSDWDSLPYTCEVPAQIQGYPLDAEGKPPAWNGKKDASFTWGTCLGQGQLFLGIHAIDDHVLTNPGNDAWQQDGLEIRMDARPEDAREVNSTGPLECEQIILLAITAGESALKPQLAFSEKLPPGICAAWRLTHDGYDVEISIPIILIEQAQGKDWKSIRINIAQDDWDGKTGPHKQIWWKPDWRTDSDVENSGTFLRPAIQKP